MQMFRDRTRAVVLAGVVCTFVAWGTPGRSQQQPWATGDLGDRPTYSCIEETEEIDEAAENIEAAAADIEAVSADSEVALQEKQQQLDESAKNIEESSEAEKEVKTQLVVNVTNLQLQLTALIDPFKVVLLAMEAKGGDPAAYRTYITAVSGVELDVTDTRGLGVRVLSWIQSEEGGVRWGINIGQFVSILVEIKYGILTAIAPFLRLLLLATKNCDRARGFHQTLHKFLTDDLAID